MIKRLLENHRIDELTARGNTTLRQVLESIASMLALPEYNSSIKYVLHHKNGDHFDNDLSNLILMPSDRHTSYHSKLHHMNIDKESSEAIEFFNKNYSSCCVFIGDTLLNKIEDSATEEAKQADEDCL